MVRGRDAWAAGLAFFGEAAFLLSFALCLADSFHLRPQAVECRGNLFLADGKLLTDRFAGVLEALVELQVLYLPMRYAKISTQTVMLAIWKVELENSLGRGFGLASPRCLREKENLLRKTSLDIFDAETARAGMFWFDDVKEMRVSEFVPDAEVFRLHPCVDVVV